MGSGVRMGGRTGQEGFKPFTVAPDIGTDSIGSPIFACPGPFVSEEVQSKKQMEADGARTYATW